MASTIDVPPVLPPTSTSPQSSSPLPSSTSTTPSLTSSSTTTTTSTTPSASTPASTTSTSSTSSTSSSTTSSTSSTSSTTTTTSTSSSTKPPGVTTVTLSLSTSSSTTSSTTSSLAPTVGSSGFFSNTGAVAGTFTVVGLVGAGLFVAFVVLIVKRRRAKKFDQEIAAAAAEANLQAGRNQPFHDDEWDEYGAAGNSGYFPSSNGTHGAYGQPPIVAATAYDPYSEDAYPLPQRRMSTGAGIPGGAAGIAGFGARGAAPGGHEAYNIPMQQYSGAQAHNNTVGYYREAQGDTRISRGYGSEFSPQSPSLPNSHDPYEVGADRAFDPYAAAGVSGAGLTAGLGRRQQDTNVGRPSAAEDPYGGLETGNEPPPFEIDVHDGKHQRDSIGSYQEGEAARPVLKVANE